MLVQAISTGSNSVAADGVAMPRKEVASYTWTDNGFTLKIVIHLSESVPRDQVRKGKLVITVHALYRWNLYCTAGGRRRGLSMPAHMPAICSSSLSASSFGRKQHCVLSTGGLQM